MGKELKNIGQKIRKIREFKAYSQDYMAEQLGLTPAAYEKLENEDSKITKEKLQQIAQILEVSVGDIESFDDKVIFTVHVHDKATGGIYNQHNHYNNDKIIGLLEDKVKLLEEKLVSKVEKITALEEEIIRLKEKYKEMNI